MRQDKSTYIEEQTAEAESTAGQQNMKRLYENTKTLSSKNSNPSWAVKDKNGIIIFGKKQQKARWAEHFEETLNWPAPSVPLVIPPPNKLLDINTNLPSKTEIVKVTKSFKSTKITGLEGIPPEAREGRHLDLN